MSEELSTRWDAILLEKRFFHAYALSFTPQGQVFVEASRELMPAIAAVLKDAGYDYLADATAIDYSKHSSNPSGTLPRFAVVWNLYSIEKNCRIFLRVRVPEDDCWAPSLVSLWRGADWPEREVFDMFGIDFKGHPDLRRIMMWEGFEGHPFRKDFPWRDEGCERNWWREGEPECR